MSTPADHGINPNQKTVFDAPTVWTWMPSLPQSTYLNQGVTLTFDLQKRIVTLLNLYALYKILLCM